MPLQQVIAQFAKGLDAATRAIYDSEQEIFTAQEFAEGYAFMQTIRDEDEIGDTDKERNEHFANSVRLLTNRKGWIAGWKALAHVSRIGGRGVCKELMGDIETGIHVFKTVDVTTKYEPTITDIRLIVVSHPNKKSLNKIGPKSIGGHTWRSNKDYLRIRETWGGSDLIPASPCVFFAWMGICKKVLDYEFEGENGLQNYSLTQLLGVVDYDLDGGSGFKGAVERVARMAIEPSETNKRAYAWTGLLTMDSQDFNRSVMYEWVKEGKGAFVTGRYENDGPGICPMDYICAGIADSAALAPFSLQEDYKTSRTGMFVAVVNSNLHDLLYDIGCSSRISCAGYARSTGALEHDIPQAFVVGIIDNAAATILAGPEDQDILYGTNTMIAAGLWNLFNVRYRAWERLVKYTRLLHSSRSPAAAQILNNARQNMILPGFNVGIDLDFAFESCLDAGNVGCLVPRSENTVEYTIDIKIEELKQTILTLNSWPVLCKPCTEAFLDLLMKKTTTVQAIPGLPDHLFKSSTAVMSAAMIRDVSIWAISAACCDSCACRLGEWANSNSDYVTIASMQSDLKLSPKTWLLECYVVGCVAVSPLRVMSVLAGFDAFVDVGFEKGAMGEQRDLVDC